VERITGLVADEMGDPQGVLMVDDRALVKKGMDRWRGAAVLWEWEVGK